MQAVEEGKKLIVTKHKSCFIFPINIGVHACLVFRNADVVECELTIYTMELLLVTRDIFCYNHMDFLITMICKAKPQSILLKRYPCSPFLFGMYNYPMMF